MNRTECKNQILNFRSAISNYERTILNPDYQISQDTQKHLIPIQQSQLNQVYGKLEKYVVKLGKNSVAYSIAFFNGDRSEVLRAISAVLQDLDYIIGKIEGISEEEFENLFKPKSTGPTVNASGGTGGRSGDGPGSGGGGGGGGGGSVHFVQVGKEFTPEGITIKDLKNPHKSYWKFIFGNLWLWIKENIIAEVIVLIIVGFFFAFIRG